MTVEEMLRVIGADSQSAETEDSPVALALLAPLALSDCKGAKSLALKNTKEVAPLALPALKQPKSTEKSQESQGSQSQPPYFNNHNQPKSGQPPSFGGTTQPKKSQKSQKSQSQPPVSESEEIYLRWITKGLTKEQADKLHAVLVKRDRSLDDRRNCIECQHSYMGRCKAGLSPIGWSDAYTLHRCKGFIEG